MKTFKEWENEAITVVLYWIGYIYISGKIHKFLNWHMPQLGDWLSSVGFPMWAKLIIGLGILAVPGIFTIVLIMLIILRSLTLIIGLGSVIFKFFKGNNEPVSGRTEKSIKS